jgi:hypothetical protein
MRGNEELIRAAYRTAEGHVQGNEGWRNSFAGAMQVTTLSVTTLALVGGLTAFRWRPRRTRPDMDAEVAAAVAAAERELSERRQLAEQRELLTA